VVLVNEDFLEMPVGAEQLWLHNLYVIVEPLPSANRSSTLILHSDGELWITNSTFQGRSTDCRAIDVTTTDGGNPTLYADSARRVPHGLLPEARRS
jgi:hypothetical protein